MDESWQVLLAPENRGRLGRAIADHIATKRWFAAKAKAIREVVLVDVCPLSDAVRVLLVEISFADGPSEVYQVPLALASGDKARQAMAGDAASVWAQWNIQWQGQEVVLLDATFDQDCHAALLQLLDSGRALRAAKGEITIERAAQYDAIRGPRHVTLASQLSQAEQSNTSILYGDRLILKLYRRIETGVNPDWELNAFLAEHNFAHIPQLGGAIEYRQPGEAPWTLGLLQRFVKNRGDAWEYTLWQLREVLERVIAQADASANVPAPSQDLFDAARQPLPCDVEGAFGPSLARTRQLAHRTAEMHVVLAGDTNDPAFAPEPATAADLRAWSDRVSKLAEQTLELLGGQLANLQPDVVPTARRVLGARAAIDSALGELVAQPIDAMRMRIHGDFHLGQVLVTDDDLVILDFEGEPARPLTERRRKQVALHDVAGMIRSFHYASRTAATRARESHPSAAMPIDGWTAAWYFWTSAEFLAAYRQTAGSAAFLPKSDDQFRRLVNACILEKAIYELQYELNNRPDWVYLPLGALAETLATG